VVIGNGLLVLSALVGAISILQIRLSQWHSNPFKLLPWQLLIAAALTVPLACYFEPVANIQWDSTTLWLTLAYNGLLSTAFGYWASITVFKNIPAVTSSLCYLGVPVLGLLLSAAMLGETISAAILTAMILIVSGIACAALGRSPRRAKQSYKPSSKATAP
jgi:drug/metabolite transporter (DMT)-like permease